MNLKKIGLVVLAVILALSMVGCGQVEELVKGVSDVVAPTGETLYNALASVIVNTDSSYYDDILGTITFTAKILDEPFEMEIEGEDGNFVDTKFVTANISRKYDDYFLVDIGDIEYTSSLYDVVTLTGHLDGSIYWTDDNSKVEKLAFKASSIVPFTGEAGEPLESKTIAVTSGAGSGEITFEKAAFTTSTFSNAYVVYFDFKNTGSTDTFPLLESLEFAQEDVDLSKSNLSVGLELDSQALEAGMFGNKTYAGKTDYYYYILTPDGEGELDPALPIEVFQYDDDFNLTYYWQIESMVDGAEEIAA